MRLLFCEKIFMQMRDNSLIVVFGPGFRIYEPMPGVVEEGPQTC